MPTSSLRLLAILAASTLTLSQPGHAQEDDDIRQIRQVVDVYFRGHATANADTMRAAFLPTARIEGIRNGVFTSWTVDQYVANFRGTPAADEASRKRVIDVIDKTGTAAMAKATLKHGAVAFTDYFVLLKSDGKWRSRTRCTTRSGEAALRWQPSNSERRWRCPDTGRHRCHALMRPRTRASVSPRQSFQLVDSCVYECGAASEGHRPLTVTSPHQKIRAGRSVRTGASSRGAPPTA
jgi:Putative lumazine-binding